MAAVTEGCNAFSGVSNGALSADRASVVLPLTVPFPQELCSAILAQMVLHTSETVALFHKIAENLRRRRILAAPPVSPLEGHLTAFRQATADFAAFMRGAAATESALTRRSIQVRHGNKNNGLPLRIWHGKHPAARGRFGVVHAPRTKGGVTMANSCAAECSATLAARCSSMLQFTQDLFRFSVERVFVKRAPDDDERMGPEGPHDQVTAPVSYLIDANDGISAWW